MERLRPPNRAFQHWLVVGVDRAICGSIASCGCSNKLSARPSLRFNTGIRTGLTRVALRTIRESDGSKSGILENV